MNARERRTHKRLMARYDRNVEINCEGFRRNVWREADETIERLRERTSYEIAWWRERHDALLKQLAEWHALQRPQPLVIGLDPGRPGGDMTAIAVREGNRVACMALDPEAGR